MRPYFIVTLEGHIRQVWQHLHIEFRYEEFTNDGDIICDEEKSEVIEVLKGIQDFSDR
jgi:hypothetical protein